MKCLQFLQIQRKKSRQFQQQLHCLQPHHRANVSNQSQTSDAHVNRVQAQGQERDKSKQVCLFKAVGEGVSLGQSIGECQFDCLLCRNNFNHTIPSRSCLPICLPVCLCQFGYTENSALDNIHQLIKSKCGQNCNKNKLYPKPQPKLGVINDTTIMMICLQSLTFTEN